MSRPIFLVVAIDEPSEYGDDPERIVQVYSDNGLAHTHKERAIDATLERQEAWRTWKVGKPGEGFPPGSEPGAERSVRDAWIAECPSPAHQWDPKATFDTAYHVRTRMVHSTLQEVTNANA